MTALVHEPPAQTEVAQMREEPRFIASLDLVALPTAISVSRMFVSDTLYRWRAMFIEPEMEAVAAELVALAVKATGPKEGTRWADIEQLNPIKLRLLGFQWHIGIEVADTSTKMLAIPADVELPTTSGLGLVDARSRAWGSYPTPRGRVLWADFAVYERTAAGLPVRPQRPLPSPPSAKVALASEPTTADLLSRLLDGLKRLESYEAEDTRMADFPENPWRDDDVLLGGLAIASQVLAALLQNIADVREGKAEPFTAVQVASVGSSMVEAGNALQSRIVNSLPTDWPAPSLPS